jgi:LysM repeat protein
MKRRTRLIVIGCAIAGTYPAAAQAASATPSPGSDFGPPKPAHLTVSGVPRPASVSPGLRAQVHLVAATRHTATAPRVHAPVVKVTVKPGDTLTAIGARTSRTWEQLASYNHVPNPNLIYPDQVLSIPPANYVPVAVARPAPAVRTVAATKWVRATSAPRTTYVHHATYVPRATSPPARVASGSGVWACIAEHESGGNPATNTGNGFYGMYQDTQSSWASGGGLAYAPSANQASAAEQTIVNQRIQAQQGWGAWPVTSRMCGV